MYNENPFEIKEDIYYEVKEIKYNFRKEMWIRLQSKYKERIITVETLYDNFVLNNSNL